MIDIANLRQWHTVKALHYENEVDFLMHIGGVDAERLPAIEVYRQNARFHRDAVDAIDSTLAKT